MSNKLVKIEDNFYEEDEISIYEILKRIIFDKNNTTYINYTLNYQEIKSYMGEVYYPRKNPKEILLDDKYLGLLFENPELKSLYEGKVKDNKDDINTKRDFLTENKILEISSLKETTKTKEEQDLISPDSYRTTVRVNKKYDKNRIVSDSIMKTYLEILNQDYTSIKYRYLL